MDATRSTEGKSKKTSAPAASHGAKPVTLMANAIRALAMDAVEKAGSGHPGAPMGMAEMGVALWDRHMRFNPGNPKWPGRDRFVLSNGHASMFQYALLHLTGYDLPMREIENLRQLHSKTPGHPEVGVTAGVETTTGPLGQGIGNAVGMALAEKLLAAEFNRDGHAIVDHHTYVFCGDGCLMEGVSHEAASLAAVWKLNKLVLFYDNNNISIDGHVDPWFHEDTPKRFEAYGWNVIANVEGNDADAVDAAIAQALQSTDKPTLICCKTIIGKGSPNKAGTAKAHGEELGDHEIELTREALDWEWPPFVVPDEVYQAWDHKTRGSAVEAEWNEAFAAYESDHPELAAEFKRRTAGDLPPQWRQVLGDTAVAMHEKAEKVASRKASQQALEVLTGELRELIGGSADLTGSNYTNTSHTPPLRFAEDGGVMRDVEGRLGRHINYGVREFGMAVVMTGMALHGGFIPYGGTFLTFSDYMRNGIRMAALMKERVIYVLTHDSIGLGGDGPTHQSIEHAAALRLIPNLDVWRPCDTLETLARLGLCRRAPHGAQRLAAGAPGHALCAQTGVRREAARRHAGHDRQRRLRSGRAGRRGPARQAGRGADRHRLRGAACAGGADDAGRGGRREGGGAGRLDAVDQRLRPAGRGLQAQRAARGHPAHRHRDGRHRLLVEVRLRRRRRHRPLWRVGARRRGDRVLRLHRRERRRHGAQSLIHSQRKTSMTINVAINGYGRIGRNILRAHYEDGKQHDIKIVAINDLGKPETNAHLTRHDTAHGPFPGSVSVDGDSMIVSGTKDGKGSDRIKVLAQRNPAELPWKDLGVDVVLECTGLFTTKEKASAHIKGGAKKVIISAPGGKDVDATIVYGVNHGVLKASDTVISNASCTTNCLAPLVQPLHQKIGVLNGLMTTIHAYTNDQVLTDVYHEICAARAAPRTA